MTGLSLRIVIAICLVAAGCGKVVDVQAERQALLDADRAFAAAAAAGEMNRVFSYWTDNAVIYPAGMPVVRGKDAIREFVAKNRAQSGFSITWEPHKAVVSQDGTLGYTIGGYKVSTNGPAGSQITRNGRYLQAWQKDDAGSWKCTLEIQAPLYVPGGPDVRPGQATH
jgi:ketosteroid isomerase-like protein